MSGGTFVEQSDQPLIISVGADSREEAIGRARGAAEQWFGHDQFTLSMRPSPRTDEWSTVTAARGGVIALAVTFTVTFVATTEVPF